MKQVKLAMIPNVLYCITHRIEGFFEIHDLFQGVSHLKDVLCEKQFVLTQVPTPSTVLFRVDIYSKATRLWGNKSSSLS